MYKEKLHSLHVRNYYQNKEVEKASLEIASFHMGEMKRTYKIFFKNLRRKESSQYGILGSTQQGSANISFSLSHQNS
jgi:hypothetical protein